MSVERARSEAGPARPERPVSVVPEFDDVPGDAPPDESRAGALYRSQRHRLIALGTIAALLVVWHMLPTLRLVNPLVMPTPFATLEALADLVSTGIIFGHFGLTMFEIGVGYAIGVTMGFVIGAALATLETLRRVMAPYILALQSLPKVVLAPLMIAWLGFGVESKIATAVAICFFPLMINTMVGLQLTRPDATKLMVALGASRRQIFTKLQLPTALPLIFVGLKHSLLLAFTGALVAEILVGSSAGLGRLVQVFNAQIAMDYAFAVVVVVAGLAVSFVVLFDALDRRIIFWRHAEEGL